MRSNIKQLRSRGYIEDEELLDYENLSKKELLELLESHNTVELIDEARANGTRLKPACDVLEISDCTYQR